MGLDLLQFKTYVLYPTMVAMGEKNANAICLVMETIWHESDGLRYLAQVGNGPARGLGQCEPPTFDWLVGDYLPKHQPALWGAFGAISPHWPSIPFEELAWNLRLATALVRVRYLAAPGTIPTTLEGRAAYWGKYYQTDSDPAKIQLYIQHAKGMK